MKPCVFLIGLLPAVLAAAPVTLSNGRIAAEFGDRGLVSLTDAASRGTYRFAKEDFAVTLGGETFEGGALAVPSRSTGQDRVTYSYAAGPYRLEVVYELRPEWRFLSKQLIVAAAPPGKFKLGSFTEIGRAHV
jgi:hypothetical protein